MKKRKKKRIRWNRILFLLIGIIIIIGGSVMGIRYFNNDNKKNRIEDKKNLSNQSNDDKNVDKKINVDLEKAPKSYQEFSNLKDGEYLTDNGYTLKIRDGIAYIDEHIIVNKTYSVPSNYIPSNAYQEVVGERCNNCINKDVMDAFRLMQSDAKAIGLNIYISSGYRGYTYQDKLYNNYVSISGKEKADTYSARPGHSEHQTGTCFDLNTIDDSFQYTDEGKWVNENAYLYGFIIRYPKGKESITGYQYESWHLRYVGKELAIKLYHDGSWDTLEEYYGISSSYE